MLKNIELVPVTIEDYQFGFDIKKTTLGEYIEKTWGDWNEEEQLNFYKKEFVIDNCFIVKNNNINIGWLKIIETDEIVDINQLFILPEYQNKGIGGKILNDIMENGINNNKRINLQVLKCNKKAQKLYEKLGFMIDDETETHYLYKYDKNVKRYRSMGLLNGNNLSEERLLHLSKLTERWHSELKK